MFTFKVLPDDGESTEVIARSRDVARWERNGRGRSLGKFSENPTMVDLYALAHTACLRQGVFAGPLNEFEETVDVEMIAADKQDEEDADPTPPAR